MGAGSSLVRWEKLGTPDAFLPSLLALPAA
jgi:hypothetical protein